MVSVSCLQRRINNIDRNSSNNSNSNNDNNTITSSITVLLLTGKSPRKPLESPSAVMPNCLPGPQLSRGYHDDYCCYFDYAYDYDYAIV